MDKDGLGIMRGGLLLLETNRYFYFVRHGETVWNVENKICGATDIELTDKGHKGLDYLSKPRKLRTKEVHSACNFYADNYRI